MATLVGMNQHTVSHWRHRFAAERLAGLEDRQRPGRPLVYGHDQRLRIVATVTQQPPDPASHRTVVERNAESRLAPSGGSSQWPAAPNAPNASPPSGPAAPSVVADAR